MFDYIAPKPFGGILCDNFMVPYIYQFSDGYIYLTNLNISLKFKKCMCNTLLLYFFWNSVWRPSNMPAIPDFNLIGTTKSYQNCLNESATSCWYLLGLAYTSTKHYWWINILLHYSIWTSLLTQDDPNKTFLSIHFCEGLSDPLYSTIWLYEYLEKSTLTSLL